MADKGDKATGGVAEGEARSNQAELLEALRQELAELRRSQNQMGQILSSLLQKGNSSPAGEEDLDEEDYLRTKLDEVERERIARQINQLFQKRVEEYREKLRLSAAEAKQLERFVLANVLELQPQPGEPPPTLEEVNQAIERGVQMFSKVEGKSVEKPESPINPKATPPEAPPGGEDEGPFVINAKGELSISRPQEIAELSDQVKTWLRGGMPLGEEG